VTSDDSGDEKNTTERQPWWRFWTWSPRSASVVHPVPDSAFSSAMVAPAAMSERAAIRSVGSSQDEIAWLR
jgi:hypothetical protein